MLKKYLVDLVFVYQGGSETFGYRYEVWAKAPRSAKAQAKREAEKEGHFGLYTGRPIFRAIEARN